MRISCEARVEFLKNMVVAKYHQSRLLPEIVVEDGQAGPNGGGFRAFCQDSAQSELTFKHTDRSFYAAAKPLQLAKPPRLLMPFFFSTQSADLRNPGSFNSSTTERQDVLFTVVSPIRAQGRRLYTEIVLCFAHQRKQLGTITGIALMNFIVKDDPGTILNQLQGAPKFHRLMKLPFTNRARLRIIKRDNSLCDRCQSSC